MKKNTLLHKLNDDPRKQSSFSFSKVIFYAIILAVVFYVGQSLMQPSKPAHSAQSAPEAIAAPTAKAVVAPAAPSTPAPALVAAAPQAPVPRVEKIAPPVPSVTAAPMPSQQNVTIIEPVEVPMKHGGSVVGYINLQPGQQIQPFSMDDKQMMVRYGENTGSVPIKATSLRH